MRIHLTWCCVLLFRLVPSLAILTVMTAVPLLTRCGVAAEPQSIGQAVDIFDGLTLDGWAGDSAHWRVEQGAIVGVIPKGTTLSRNTWLVWEGGELTDFDLQLQFKLQGLPAANSGIQFRSQVTDSDHVSGYQADLDMGATWLGRIYDEHGRALLVERGSRVHIDATGKRSVDTLAPASQYAVLFRENDWNDYRIVASGDRISVFINGTLFSDLRDEQQGEQDLTGALAFQLHSGPETRVEFRNIRLETLAATDSRLPPFRMKPQSGIDEKNAGVFPTDANQQPLNPGFETGTLEGWTATGNAFDGQPVSDDGIARRWPGQTSGRQGRYFVGGYEIVADRGTGTLTSIPFTVTHPFASFLIGGGQDRSTRAEILLVNEAGQEQSVFLTATGQNREQMRRVAVDLSSVQGQRIAVRLVDENPGAWGHLNFDDFRFHTLPPVAAEDSTAGRSTSNPLLQHLIPNPVERPEQQQSAAAPVPESAIKTLEQMFVPEGFSVDLIAAEPDLHQPMAFTFDAKGRLWVVEGHSYPQKRAAGQGLDRILIFADNDHDGHFEHRTVFIEGLNLVSGIEVGHGGVWVGAAPHLMFIPDRNGNDIPDGLESGTTTSESDIPPGAIVLLDGFGFADTHETLNSFLWGPDGWLYGNQGVFNTSRIGKPGTAEDQRVTLNAGVWRYHPTRHIFEVFATGGSNQWGLDYDEAGQLLMTHCRSYWGRGLTTHVMQNGHYWNQVNAGYADFVSATAVPGRPWMANYLLASARYGHGEGGAGKAGSREVYGGHSHVGTMIYLGDNWPAEYHNHLFTHNLHGHQLNHQKNLRESGGYNTVHAGSDVLFCADPQYIGVGLKCGPDGAVYLSDWYDPRHCHNPNAEEWDRSNGRIYRMKFDATFTAASVDYTRASDAELLAAQLHPNDWHARMARLVLSERAAAGRLQSIDWTSLQQLSDQPLTVAQRLRILWTQHVTGQSDSHALQAALEDPDERVRGWAVQLSLQSDESLSFAPLQTTAAHRQELLTRLATLAQQDDSLFVRRYLASAISRVPADVGWQLAEAICHHESTTTDRDLPLLTWYGLAPLTPQDVPRALRLADESRVPAIADYLRWYTAAHSSEARDVLVRQISDAPPADTLPLLQILQLAIQDQHRLSQPVAWSQISMSLYSAPDARISHAAELVGAAFGDPSAFQRIRDRVRTERVSGKEFAQALQVLSREVSAENLTLYLQLLDNPQLAEAVIPQLAKYNDPRIPDVLLDRLPELQGSQSSAAMEVLCSRPAWASRVLDRIAAGQLPASQLTAFFARQMATLGDAELNARLERDWGRLGQTSAELKDQITALEESYKSAPLWAYSQQAGEVHFKKLCAQCHLPGQPAAALAPLLAGSGSKGIGYLVENIIDPNAVIGKDFQARIIVTTEGRVVTGLIEKESDSALTIRTLNDSTTAARDDIEEIRVSENSFMPTDLLKTLTDRERIELLKYLMSL